MDLLWRQTHISNNDKIDHKMLVLVTILIVNACIAGTIPATPENITITFLTPTTVRVSWQTMIDLNAHPIEKYIVTYKPTDDRVVQDVAGNSEAIILDRLSPSTQYSIAVTAIWLGKKYRSRQIIFRTLDMPKTSSQQDYTGAAGAPGLMSSNSNSLVGINTSAAGVGNGFGGGSASGNLSGPATNNSGIYGEDVTSTATNTLPHGRHRELPTIRGVEIGIVLIVLMVWAGAIALFFNRWGKIRMLLPYQPDYKHEQLKVPGTGVCSGGVCNGQHSHQHFHMLQEERSASISERCTRSRINSAIFVSSEGRGFDSIEFLRRHGSQSVLCRKARSAENITDNDRKKSFAENKRAWCTDEANESDSNAYANANDSSDGNAIELQECRPSVSGATALVGVGAGAGVCIAETRTLPVLTTTTTTQGGDYASTSACAAYNLNATGKHGRSASVTTANVVVGSISLETPPAHIKDEFNAATNVRANTSSFDRARSASGSGSGSGSGSERRARPTNFAGMSSKSSASHDSTDTVEELVLVPTVVAAAAVATVAPAEVRCSRPRILVRQRTSNTGISPNHSPNRAQLSLTGVRPKLAAALPLVSVSGPTPPQEKPLPQPQVQIQQPMQPKTKTQTQQQQQPAECL